ncbi:ecto-NOX disulfide-thiol exchanger 1 isoform X2 [Nelusetta ayraudi]|uniref:ecto-NOX disulfide-thiol exchanger 1 isoform X2 n=2 Tax=Nelusetta ayraudi TaxID=303726 RepID=UPI003F7041F5
MPLLMSDLGSLPLIGWFHGGRTNIMASAGSASPEGSWSSALGGLAVVPLGLGGQQLLSDSLCIQRFDPSLGLITSPINPIMTSIGLAPPSALAPPPPGPPDLPVVKEIIHSQSCTLFPQNPNLPPPSTRERPPGCRTVFVGGLPENATEEVIRDVFHQCGEIAAIRKSKKNFCHIRFSEEFMVDKAIYLSGYRMRIGSSADKKDSGKIHVDFAQARDDLYEWECKQRHLAREERHRRRIQEGQLTAPSPPPVVHYSEHEASLLAEKLKDDHRLGEATAVLMSWVERGEVSRRNANHFYSLIQSANGHVRRLMAEKAQQEEELENAKGTFQSALTTILTQFEQIIGVFAAATRQKAWDHFSKAQRKNIDIWRKQCEELRSAYSEEVMGSRREEEMEMSDEDLEEEEKPCKRRRWSGEDGGKQQQQQSLLEENDSLRWQLEAYRNEVELLRKEGAQRGHDPQQVQHIQQVQNLQQSLHSTQQQLLCLQEKLSSKDAELEQARKEHQFLKGEMLNLRDKLSGGGDSEGPPAELQNQVLNGCVPSLHHSRRRKRSEVIARGAVASEKEALLLGIISTFLHVHPFGANLEYLWSYIQRLDPQVSAVHLERLMLRLPNMFRQELSGVGATLEKRWKFCGFDSMGSV